MRQPSFDRGPRGPHAQNQGGIQKIDAQQRAVIWRLTKYVLSDYKFSIITVLVCIAVTSVTTLASTLFTRTLIDDYIVPLTQTANPEYTALWDTLIKLGIILFVGVICSYLYSLTGYDAPSAPAYLRTDGATANQILRPALPR